MAKTSPYNFLGSYNKAYKTKRIDEKDFEKFINKLKTFYEHTSSIEKANEELLKDKFKECILNEYQTYANENRVDLAIKKDNKTQVILEFKKPSNINEMLQINSDDFNKKALQEAIWYFYNQENLETSYQIKNVVITDTEKFFFFNPKGFCNKDLEKICVQFRNAQVAYRDTETLYRQIKEKIQTKELKFDYTEFDLKQYKNKILNSSLNDNDKRQLKYFYKALHPDFLLREYSPKDSNELNSKFYSELLYILGLKEEGKNQKLIKPSEQTGTLRDCIYNELSVNEKDKFEVSINLIIVWLSRILFLKLFESQLIAFNDNNKDFAFLTSDKVANFNFLNQLFFNILGKQISERTEQFKDFNKIPYLNSSLFELSDYEKKHDLKISGLYIEAALPLRKGSILSKEKNYPQNPKLLKYLLDFLNAYHFNSNISEINDNNDIINSSVLGLIFEKLNGYKDGSFFTPGYITEYMAEQSINNVILQKFNKVFEGEKSPCQSVEDLKNLLNYDAHIKERRDFYNEIIDDLKICDPAVGSGHFLVSTLNYLIYLKSYFGLLDIKNPIEVQNDTLVIYEQDGETQFRYKRNDKNTSIIQKAIFDEKRKIIENCLFGVDINSNSVQICCLRLWIELLKNTYYIDNTDDMQVLPNIDINIKEGNSLVSGYKVKVGHCAIEELDGRTVEAKGIKEYKKLVAEYKNIEGKISKTELKTKIKAIKDKIFPTRQLKLFEDNSTKGIMKDSMEWMIEFPEILDENGVFQGFDLIIANPPYGIINKKQNQKVSIETEIDFFDFLKNEKEYLPASTGMMNIYKFFILRGFQLLKRSGVFSQIFPLSFACDISLKNIRKYIFDNYSIIDIEAFPERDSAKRRVFENAKVSVCILNALKEQNSSNSFYIRKNNDKFIDSSIMPTKLDIQDIKSIDGENTTIPIVSNFDLNLLIRISKKATRLKEFAHCYTGEIDLSLNSKYITSNPNDSEMIKGAIIDRYVKKTVMSQGEIQYLNSEKYLDEIKAEKSNHHRHERIVMQGLTGVNEMVRLKMTLLPANAFCANSVNYIVFENKNISPKYVLGLLNSTLLNYLFKISSTNSNVNGYEVDSLPLLFMDHISQKQIILLVDKILELKQGEDYQQNIEKQNTLKEYEEQIDLMVYKLYNLTFEEILAIDPDFKMSEQDYDSFKIEKENANAG